MHYYPGSKKKNSSEYLNFIVIETLLNLKKKWKILLKTESVEVIMMSNSLRFNFILLSREAEKKIGRPMLWKWFALSHSYPIAKQLAKNEKSCAVASLSQIDRFYLFCNSRSLILYTNGRLYSEELFDWVCIVLEEGCIRNGDYDFVFDKNCKFVC